MYEDARLRAYLALDWMCRVQLPACLDAAGIHRLAERVRALPALRDDVSCKAALKTLREARIEAKGAAGYAASYTDLDPSGYKHYLHSWRIARAAAQEALDRVDAAILYPIWQASAFFARDESWDIAMSSAYASCKDAIWSVVSRVTWDAVRDPDLYIALSVADRGLYTDAAKVARDNSEKAARSAAFHALKPTVERLQRSALSLVDRTGD